MAVIIIVLITSTLVHGRTDRQTDGQGRHIRLLVCTHARSLKMGPTISMLGFGTVTVHFVALGFFWLRLCAV